MELENEDVSIRRKDAERRLVQMEDRYLGLLEAAPDAMVVVNEVGNIILLNLRAESLFGYLRNELLGEPIKTIIPHGFAERLLADGLRTTTEALAQQIGTGIELTGMRKDGARFPIEIMLSPLETAEGLLITAAIRDITKRKNTENRIIYLNRIYAMLSGINSLIIRVQERDVLFNEACRIAVESAGFSKAWIGLVDEQQMKVLPAGSAGVNPEMLATLRTRYSLNTDESRDATMVVRAINEKKSIVSNLSRTEDRVLFEKRHLWPDIQSVAILPLLIADKAAGVLALYSNATAYFDEEEMRLLTELAGNISFAIDNIDKRKQLDYLAYYDALTGLANHRLFLERVAQHVRIAQRDGHKLAIYLVDLEGFKNINDSHGQTAGDSLLRQVAEWLSQNLGDVTLLARVGADHFAAVLPKVRRDSDVASLLKKTMVEFQEHSFQINETELRISAKVGVALFPDDALDADELYKKTEAALKRAKEDGDRFLFYTRKMTAMVAHRLSLETHLRKALENEEFIVHYQPKVDIVSGKVTSAEALIRWNDPRTGLVAPGQFIPILEETGLIHEVGRWALYKANSDYLRWRSMGLEAMRIAVNVSQLQLRDAGFVNEIQKLTAMDNHAAAGLELEITESLIMEDINHCITTLQAIRNTGVTVAIDDFGTGYSSLSYLAKLPLDTLKIDRTFIHDMTVTHGGMVLVQAIISLAHLLNLKVVAEGVETDEQLNQLRILGCNEMQGYLFSKPLPRELFEARYLTQAN